MAVAYIIEFIVSVAAQVVAYFLCPRREATSPGVVLRTAMYIIEFWLLLVYAETQKSQGLSIKIHSFDKKARASAARAVFAVSG